MEETKINKFRTSIPFLLLFLFLLDLAEDYGDFNVLNENIFVFLGLLLVGAALCLNMALSFQKMLFLDLSCILHWFYMAGLAGLIYMERGIIAACMRNVFILHINYGVVADSMESTVFSIICCIAAVMVQNKARRVLSGTPSASK